MAGSHQPERAGTEDDGTAKYLFRFAISYHYYASESSRKQLF